MPEQIENRIIVDSEWEFLETQLRIHDRYSKRKRVFDEMEYGRMEEEE